MGPADTETSCVASGDSTFLPVPFSDSDEWAVASTGTFRFLPFLCLHFVPQILSRDSRPAFLAPVLCSRPHSLSLGQGGVQG